MYGKPFPFPNLDDKSVRTVLSVQSSRKAAKPDEKQRPKPTPTEPSCLSWRASPALCSCTPKIAGRRTPGSRPPPLARGGFRPKNSRLQASTSERDSSPVSGRHPHKPQRLVASADATSLQFRLGGSLRCASLDFSQMNCIPLKDINQNSYRVKICARITRLFQFILEDKPDQVLRLDFVLVDHERNAIEAQVPQNHLDRFTSPLKEGVVYFIEFFQVVPAKTNYQAVDHMYMIRFTSHTKLSEFHDVPETFPKYAYTLVSFDALRTRIDYTKHMSDTIGQVVSVEPITTAHVKGVSKPKRHLYISDEREYVEVVLWNRQATEFPAEEIIKSSKERPIILLLLGITAKSREGQLKIQASTTCQYHVNPSIPEATALEKRFAALPHQVALAGSTATTSDVIINTSVGELAKKTNPHELCGIIYQVDVALKTLSPNQPWWYLGCISYMAYTLEVFFPLQMNCIPLKDINQNSYRVKICARLTRLFQFILEDKPNQVLRLDFVLVDHERNAIEAQVPQNHVDLFTSPLKEGVVYFIEFFQVVPAKTNYQAVDHMYMIRFTSHTKLSEFHDVPETFPKCAYTLVSFDALRTRVDYTKHMSDTIGQVVSVEPITTAHVKGVSKPKRHLYISDEREYVEVVLWNRQATEFPAEEIIKSSKERPIILLLLGITAKSREGQLKIQASTTCQYHVNPSIPEATALEKRFAALPHQVALAGSTATTSDVIINTSVGELAKKTNPHELCGIIYQVDVALKTLSPNQPWWYLGCISCKKRVFPEGDTYICPKCSGNKAEPMYRITVIAGDPQNFMEDNAPTIEIIFFGAIGEELIGIQALHLAALYNVAIPSELTRLYNHKYTLTISVPLSSMQRENISFRTKSIVAMGGPLIIAPPAHHTSSGTHQHQIASTEQTTNLTCLPPGTATTSKGKNTPHHEDNTTTPLPTPQRLETMISPRTITNVSTSEAAYLQNDLPSTSRVRLSSPTGGEEIPRVRRRL